MSLSGSQNKCPIAWVIAIVLIGLSGEARSQGILIESGAHLVTNGSAYLVLHDSKFTNSGNFVSGTGTVLITGTVTGAGSEIGGSSNTKFYNLTIDNPAGVSLGGAAELYGALTLSSNGIFDADGTGSGSFTVKSTSDDGTGDAKINALPDPANLTGNITVERYMSGEGRRWRSLSSPVATATVVDWQDDFEVSGTFAGADPSTYDNPSVYYYDETVLGVADMGWVAYPDPSGSNTAPLIPGSGYSAFIREDIRATIIDVTGPINKGDIDLNLTYTDSPESANEDGWNLVGNPYPAPLDWESIFADGSTVNVDPTFAVWDMGNNRYSYYTAITGVSIGGGVKDIALGQGFWTQTTATNPALIVKESMKSTTNAGFSRTEQLQNLLKIRVSNSISTDETAFHFLEDALAETDLFDAFKLENNIFNFSTISDENIHMAINAHPTPDHELTVRLSLQDIDPDGYQMNFEGVETFEGLQSLILRDNFLNIDTDLFVNTGYDFNVTDNSASWGDDRFELKFDMIGKVTSTKKNLKEEIIIYPNPARDILTVEVGSKEYTQITIINNIGLEVAGSHPTSNNKFVFDVSNLPNGIYFLKVITSSEELIEKIMVSH